MGAVSERQLSTRSLAAQLEFEMRRDEPIWTESSYKYRPDGIADLLDRAGFRVETRWIDDIDGFVVTLAGS